MFSDTALAKTERQGCVPVESSASFLLIYALSIHLCMSVSSTVQYSNCNKQDLLKDRATDPWLHYPEEKEIKRSLVFPCEKFRQLHKKTGSFQETNAKQREMDTNYAGQVNIRISMLEKIDISTHILETQSCDASLHDCVFCEQL